MNSNKVNGSLFIDFKQTFDTINRTILAEKRSYYGLSDSCVQLLSSVLTDRGQCVSFNKSIFPLTFIYHGVLKGYIFRTSSSFNLYQRSPVSVLHGTCDIVSVMPQSPKSKFKGF